MITREEWEALGSVITVAETSGWCGKIELERARAAYAKIPALPTTFGERAGPTIVADVDKRITALAEQVAALTEKVAGHHRRLEAVAETLKRIVACFKALR